MTAPAPRPPIDVAAAVIIRGGEVLLARRVGGYLDGLWEFPGGKMEPGESAPAAAEREILEELHLHVRARARVLVLEHDYPDKRIRLHFVTCSLLPVPPAATPAHETGWFPPDRFPWAEFCPADQVAARHLPWTDLLT
ncbi:MAG: (deoxy)nucleoside triphosphate pyrophosphohydrolase [Candidatus Riflebacteria bacterium]|nr:(deoxy)nucleoside triphosphate pyrophosphohydrolase [Candidatus Riflebacteria bacterium]